MVDRGQSGKRYESCRPFPISAWDGTNGDARGHVGERQRDFCQPVFVRVSHDFGHTGQGSYFLWRALGNSTGWINSTGHAFVWTILWIMLAALCWTAMPPHVGPQIMPVF